MSNSEYQRERERELQRQIDVRFEALIEGIQNREAAILRSQSRIEQSFDRLSTMVVAICASLAAEGIIGLDEAVVAAVIFVFISALSWILKRSMASALPTLYQQVDQRHPLNYFRISDLD